MASFRAEAMKMAYEWHDGQLRKHTGLPYIIHPVAVSAYVERAIHADPAWEGWRPNHDAIVCAAMLHDVIEDCGVNEDDFIAEFGWHTGTMLHSLVLQVSEVSRPDMGNRKHRRSLDAEHYSKASPGMASVKLADIIDNAIGIRRDDQKFWKVYQQEMIDLLPKLKHGCPSLYYTAQTVIIN